MEAVDVDGTRVVNFTQWTEFYRYLNDVHRHKAPDVSRDRLPKAGMLAYLEQQLHCTPPGSAAPDLEKRSNMLQDEENRMSKQKIDRFNEVCIR